MDMIRHLLFMAAMMLSATAMDVVAGAGIGILSVETAYWLYPTVTRALFPKRYRSNVSLSPFASPHGKGLSCRIVF